MTHDDDNEADGKKERVLHTRVPAVLEKELKRLATNLRVPVSNVVRAILEDAVEVADVATKRTEAELRGWAEKLGDERERLRKRVRPSEIDEPEPEEAELGRDPLEGVIGFQPLVLASAMKCAKCGRSFDEGDEAFVGIGGKARVVIGRECLPAKKKENQS